MKNIIRGFMGLLLIVLSVGLIFYWEVYGRERILYDDIVVLTEEVSKRDVIEETMLTYVKREGSIIIEGAILDPHKIIGKAATCYIPKGTQLVDKYFEDMSLVLGEGQYIFRIPNGWLQAYPGSLRRGDTVYFHEISNDQFRMLGTNEADSVEAYRPMTSKEAIAQVTVAYAKDSANREVITLSEDERYDGSSKISEIEIIVDMDTVNTLKQSIEEGKTFILMYQ